MERDTYYNKIEEILSDTTTYEKVIKNLGSIIERKLNSIIEKKLNNLLKK